MPSVKDKKGKTHYSMNPKVAQEKANAADFDSQANAGGNLNIHASQGNEPAGGGVGTEIAPANNCPHCGGDLSGAVADASSFSAPIGDIGDEPSKGGLSAKPGKPPHLAGKAVAGKPTNKGKGSKN